MRKSNWKVKLLVFIAFICGLAAALAVAFFLPAKYDLYRGLLSFGSFAVVSLVSAFAASKILRIGRD